MGLSAIKEAAPQRERRSRSFVYGLYMDTIKSSPTPTTAAEKERLSYSLKEAADLLGVDYFSVYRLIQRGKLRACRALRGKLLVSRTELLRLLKTE